MSQIYRQYLLLLVLALAGAQASNGTTAGYRIWTDAKGRQIEARMLNYADGIVTIRKPTMQEYDVPMEQFSAADQSFVTLSVFEPKYREAKKNLEAYLKEKGNQLLTAEHTEQIHSIITYLRAMGKGLENDFGEKGNYHDGADFSTRAHSGMLYFANDWLSQLEDFQNPESMSGLGFRVGNALSQIEHIDELFTTLTNGKSFIKEHLGQQFEVDRLWGS